MLPSLFLIPHSFPPLRLPHCPHFLHKAPKSSPKAACSDRVRQVRPFNLPDLGYPLFYLSNSENSRALDLSVYSCANLGSNISTCPLAENGVNINLQSIIKPSITYEISPCPVRQFQLNLLKLLSMHAPLNGQMTSNPPPSPGKDAPHRSMVSPAQAIAEAWKRETLESQERWRKLNEEMKRKYQEARRRYPVSKM